MLTRSRPFALLTLLLVAACGTVPAWERGASADGGVRSVNGATVIDGVDLEDGYGSILSAMQGKVPNFRIQRHSGQCPELSLRNDVTFRAVVNPHVYVDGARATDTCILESLRTEDVQRVEVYPMGFTTRPGYGTHAHGLILVFMRSSG